MLYIVYSYRLSSLMGPGSISLSIQPSFSSHIFGCHGRQKLRDKSEKAERLEASRSDC